MPIGTLRGADSDSESDSEGADDADSEPELTNDTWLVSRTTGTPDNLKLDTSAATHCLNAGSRAS